MRKLTLNVMGGHGEPGFMGRHRGCRQHISMRVPAPGKSQGQIMQDTRSQRPGYDPTVAIMYLPEWKLGGGVFANLRWWSMDPLHIGVLSGLFC